MRYGKAYPAVYVNVLYRAVCRAMHGPFRFVCLTDDAAGLLPGIEALAIPDVGLTPAQWYAGGVWPKIGLYDRSLHGLKGRALFIDLDMVVLQGLDEFFEYQGPFAGLNAGPGWGRGGTPTEFGSAIVSFEIGAFAHIAQTFAQNPAQIMRTYATEQAFVAACVPQIDFWPEGWVLSFKRSLRRPIGMDLFLEPKKPPADAKVVAFHGTPRPRDLLRKGPLFWDRMPHLGNRPVSWMLDYWRDHGGDWPAQAPTLASPKSGN